MLFLQPFTEAVSSSPSFGTRASRTTHAPAPPPAAFPELVTLQTPGVFTNLVDVFDEGLRRSKGGPLLGHRPILSRKPLTHANHHVWQSWPEVDTRRRALGSAVHALFQTGELVAGDLETVGIWSKNSSSESRAGPGWVGSANRCVLPDWFLVDLAMQAYGKVSVPLYDTLGADSVGTHLMSPIFDMLSIHHENRICVCVCDPCDTFAGG